MSESMNISKSSNKWLNLLPTRCSYVLVGEPRLALMLCFAYSLFLFLSTYCLKGHTKEPEGSRRPSLRGERRGGVRVRGKGEEGHAHRQATSNEGNAGYLIWQHCLRKGALIGEVNGKVKGMVLLLLPCIDLIVWINNNSRE